MESIDETNFPLQLSRKPVRTNDNRSNKAKSKAGNARFYSNSGNKIGQRVVKESSITATVINNVEKKEKSHHHLAQRQPLAEYWKPSSKAQRSSAKEESINFHIIDMPHISDRMNSFQLIIKSNRWLRLNELGLET